MAQDGRSRGRDFDVRKSGISHEKWTHMDLWPLQFFTHTPYGGWLVLTGTMKFYDFQLGMSSSQLKIRHIFAEGLAATTKQIGYITTYIKH